MKDTAKTHIQKEVHGKLAVSAIMVIYYRDKFLCRNVVISSSINPKKLSQTFKTCSTLKDIDRKI